MGALVGSTICLHSRDLGVILGNTPKGTVSRDLLVFIFFHHQFLLGPTDEPRKLLDFADYSWCFSYSVYSPYCLRMTKKYITERFLYIKNAKNLRDVRKSKPERLQEANSGQAEGRQVNLCNMGRYPVEADE
jgi:hypothetical protein